jgi:hypothetical protein
MRKTREAKSEAMKLLEKLAGGPLVRGEAARAAVSFTRPGGIWKMSVPPAGSRASARSRKRANAWQSLQQQTKRLAKRGAQCPPRRGLQA